MSEPARLVGDGFQLRFERRADRYSQVLEVQRGAGHECVAESIEDTSDDLWPASPPLQDLHIEQREGGVQVALLVGRAGRSHWSLSIEVNPNGSELRFDAACRTDEKPRWLGSTYKLVQPTCIAWECMVGADETLDKDQLSISADVTGSTARTIRWQYRLMVHRPRGMV